MEALPIEIGVQILTYAITDHPTPISSIAIVHSSWAAIVLSILHKNLIFKNLSQLIGFAQSYSSTGRSGENHHLASIAENAPKHSGNRIYKAAPSPCTISFLPSITTTDVSLFQHIYAMFQSCSSLERLERVDMRVNSHMKGASEVYNALSQINPRYFSWRSPDPDHHFSISIVSLASDPLSKAMSTWSNLQHLRLCNMHLLSRGWELVNCFDPNIHRNLETIHIGQTVQMDPLSPVGILLKLPMLRKISLVDVYLGSIWGKRLRVEDMKWVVEDRGHNWDALNLNSRIVCGVERERIIGGDRGL